MMPRMDGLQFCSIVKNDPKKSPIPFVMLTAKNSIEDEITGINSGADAYLGKPVSAKLLTSTIQNLLSQQKRIKDHLSDNYLSKTIEDTLQIKDKEFYDCLIQVIEKHIGDFDLDVNLISKELNCSRTKLYQKVKDTTGKAIMDLVRSVRLRKAVQIMAEEDISIQEIMQKVGIQSQSYFTRSFKKEFGKTPGQFARDLKI
jgi:AraC-like DNA-binding protein